MTQNELAVRMAAEETAFRKNYWTYHLDRGVMELLAPPLEELVGSDFTAYVQALEDHARSRSWAAYQTGKHLGEVAVKKGLPSDLANDLPMEVLVGSVPYSEQLRALQERVRVATGEEAGKFFELYDLAALEIQGIQEIRAALWGLQDSGVDMAWVSNLSGYLPGEYESPDWL